MDLNGIIDRLKETCGLKTDKEIAKLLGFSPANFSLRKKRGTIHLAILDYAINQSIDLNWLLTGKQENTVPFTSDSTDLFIKVKSIQDEFNSFRMDTNIRFSIIESKLDKLIENSSIHDVSELEKKILGEG